jgi:hypothetical protein
MFWEPLFNGFATAQRLTLAAAGVTDGCSLLAYFATSSDKGACFICVVNP